MPPTGRRVTAGYNGPGLGSEPPPGPGFSHGKQAVPRGPFNRGNRQNLPNFNILQQFMEGYRLAREPVAGPHPCLLSEEGSDCRRERPAAGLPPAPSSARRERREEPVASLRARTSPDESSDGRHEQPDAHAHLQRPSRKAMACKRSPPPAHARACCLTRTRLALVAAAGPHPSPLRRRPAGPAEACG